MRALLVPSLIIALLSSANAIAEGPEMPGGNAGNVEPVLVHVNAQGKVTDVLPAYRLSPELMHLLRSNLDEMIHTPAKDKQGRPIPSQFVINLTLQSKANGKGGYDAHFEYVSATPVPPGTWYWTRDISGRVGLANQDALPRTTFSNNNFMANGGPNKVAGNRGH
jgi:hypothetical protein